MGSIQAQEMAETLDIESAIAWHLRSNHFPPIPLSMVPVCIEAIENALAGEWTKLVSLPEGVGYRGLTAAPTDAIIAQHHLDPWVELDEEGMWDE
jgi:hypothetical protein